MICEQLPVIFPDTSDFIQALIRVEAQLLSKFVEWLSLIAQHKLKRLSFVLEKLVWPPDQLFNGSLGELPPRRVFTLK